MIEYFDECDQLSVYDLLFGESYAVGMKVKTLKDLDSEDEKVDD